MTVSLMQEVYVCGFLGLKNFWNHVIACANFGSFVHILKVKNSMKFCSFFLFSFLL